MRRKDSGMGGGDRGAAGEDRLSTEDLARPRKTAAPSSGRTGARADAPPEFPGEATATGQSAHGSDAVAAEPAVEEEPLLGAEEAEVFRSRWQAIQAEFVDDPQDAVHGADALVAEVMQTLATSFSSHKEVLQGQWGRGEEVATEDLRLALQHYRSFFNRLLSA